MGQNDRSRVEGHWLRRNYLGSEPHSLPLHPLPSQSSPTFTGTTRLCHLHDPFCPNISDNCIVSRDLLSNTYSIRVIARPKHVFSSVAGSSTVAREVSISQLLQCLKVERQVVGRTPTTRPDQVSVRLTEHHCRSEWWPERQVISPEGRLKSTKP